MWQQIRLMTLCEIADNLWNCT